MEAARSKDGTTIAFDRSGGGPSVVLIGGALSDRAAAVELVEELSPRFTVIAYDRRGRGDSEDTPPYSVDREVEDVEALIVAAGGRAHVFGHSSGAVLALETARAFRDRITSLALYEPPFIVDDSRPPLPAEHVTRLERLVSAGRRGDAVEYFLRTGPRVPPEVVAGMRGEPFWPSLESVAHTLAYDGTIMGDTMGGSPDPLRRWASVEAPTLVMDGGASPGWQRNAVRALVAVIPGARHRTLEGQGHGPDSKVLAPALEAFFNGRPARTSDVVGRTSDNHPPGRNR
jgi:pimeloyl-ACP methyl ester carboxylesterase